MLVLKKFMLCLTRLTSTFNFEEILRIRNLKLFFQKSRLCRPAIWKKSMGLGPSKKESLDLARLKFGESDLWNIKSNDGIAEAALLTLFWLEKFNSN